MTSPTPELTTVAAFAGLGLTLATLAFSAAGRRRLGIERVETARRLDALAARVTALETQKAAALLSSRPVPVPARTPVAVLRVDRPAPTSMPGPTLISVPNMAANSSESPATDLAASEMGRRYAPIWEMAETGLSAEAIARATGQPIGQVELILGLKRQGAASEGPRPK